MVKRTGSGKKGLAKAQKAGLAKMSRREAQASRERLTQQRDELQGRLASGELKGRDAARARTSLSQLGGMIKRVDDRLKQPNGDELSAPIHPSSRPQFVSSERPRRLTSH